MAVHRILSKSVTMPSGAQVDIKYWADKQTIYVAGFDRNDKQVTRATYQAVVNEMADDFYTTFHQSLIDGLVSTVENDLKENPALHYRP